MRIIITIYLICFQLILFAQNDTLNTIDKNGLKQGYWKEYNYKKLVSSHEDFGNNSNEIIFYDTLLLAEGNYKNSQKIGTWMYYNLLNTNQNILEKTITYLDNNRFIEKNIYYNYTIETDIDTSYIKGEFYNKLDTVFFSCDNNNCIFFLDEEKILKSFPKNRFEYEFYGLLMGDYNREIRFMFSD